jgi:hypothetical protein
MDAFLSPVIIQNVLAEYEIFQVGNKFKALLLTQNNSRDLPYQLTFWKEAGKWKTYNQLTDHVIYQFGNNIDNHLLSISIKTLKGVNAA